MSKTKAQKAVERQRRLINGQRRIQYRLRERQGTDQPSPMLAARNVDYQLADRSRGLGAGGMGAMHLPARRSGLVEAIDRRLHLLKLHLPYHESDHVLNIAYNILCSGTCLEDIELRRNDEVFLDALGAQRIPDPTTAGHFCRRFDGGDIHLLMNTINDVRVGVWQQQAESFFDEALLDRDGVLATTTGQCKQGMDISYNGQWGYHPLVVSLANAAEPLADNLAKNRWKRLKRPAKYEIKTAPRQRPQNVKGRIVRQPQFENIRLQWEQVAEFAYRPTLCRKTYRVVVVRKNLSVEKGEAALFDDIRYFFYITNDVSTPADEMVFCANDRCHQENLIEQLKNGVRALRMPVDNLLSNGAYMVMASLTWTLKAWFALSLPQTGRWAAKYKSEKQAVLRMEFKKFLNAFLLVPCQIIRGARRMVYRLLAWNPWPHVFLRGVDALRCPMRC